MDYKQITTLAAAFAALNLAPDFAPDVTGYPEADREHAVTDFKLKMVVAAINGGWKPDWKNTDEYKYYPWWNIDEDDTKVSGRGLSLDAVFCADSCTTVGPRLVFQDRKRAEHAVEHFTDLYEEYYFGK